MDLEEDLKQQYKAPEAEVRKIEKNRFFRVEYDQAGRVVRMEAGRLARLRKLSRKHGEILDATITKDRRIIYYRIRDFESNHERLEALMRLQ